MDLIAYINKNYYEKNGKLKDDMILALNDDSDDDLEDSIPAIHLENNSLNLNDQLDPSLSLQPSNESEFTRFLESEDSESNIIGCFLFQTPNRCPIQVENVAVKSISNLRSNCYKLLDKIKRGAMASNVIITCDCLMNNWKIGCKKFTGSGKVTVTYDSIEYKSTKLKKSPDWNTFFDFSG